MSWEAITEDDVWAHLTSAEERAVRTKLLTAGQTDPMTKVIKQVTLRIRTSVKSCKDNVLSDDVTLIPSGLIFEAVAMIKYKLLGRLKLIEVLGDESVKEDYKDAKAYLLNVAKCVITVDRYGAPEEDAAPEGMKPTISAPDRKFSKVQQDGI